MVRRKKLLITSVSEIQPKRAKKISAFLGTQKNPEIPTCPKCNSETTFYLQLLKIYNFFQSLLSINLLQTPLNPLLSFKTRFAGYTGQIRQKVILSKKILFQKFVFSILLLQAVSGPWRPRNRLFLRYISFIILIPFILLSCWISCQ